MEVRLEKKKKKKLDVSLNDVYTLDALAFLI